MLPVFGRIFDFRAILRKLNRSQPIIDGALFSNLHVKIFHSYVAQTRIALNRKYMLTWLFDYYIFHGFHTFHMVSFLCYVEKNHENFPHATIMISTSNLQKLDKLG